MNKLQRLIADRMAERGWSYADIAERGELARATVHSLAKRSERQTPQRESLEALAKGLDLPLGLVLEAAVDAAGYAVEHVEADAPDLELLVATVRELTDEDRAQVRRIAETFLERARRDRPQAPVPNGAEA